MSDVIEIRGLEAVQRSLAKLEPAPAKKLLQKASSAGAKVLKPFVKAATPRGKTGRLQRSISAGQARKERPSAIVKFRPGIAFYRHMVIDGTKPHRIRFPDQKAAGVPTTAGNIAHPGAKANPILDRAWSTGGAATLRAVDKTIDDYLEKI